MGVVGLLLFWVGNAGFISSTVGKGSGLLGNLGVGEKV